MQEYKIVIIGGGAAGLAAAYSAYQAGERSILILEKTAELGGILNQCIHNGFGLTYFKEELTGPEYASRFIELIKDAKIDYKVNAMVYQITEDKKVCFTCPEGAYEIQAKAIIVSTGCYERSRGKIATDGDRPSGVMSAGTAQKYINQSGYMVGKKVFILGSGDIGLIMARRLTLEGAKVLGVAEIMPYSNGLNRNIVQCLNDYNIPLSLSTSVKEIIGKKRLEKIVLANVDENLKFISGTEREVECDTLLLSVGLIPSNELLEAIGVKMNPKTKGPVVNQSLETSVKGIFACGNNLHVHDLVDYVTKEAFIAGEAAAKFVREDQGKSYDIEVKPLGLVSYVVPNFIQSDSGVVNLKFRVRKPLKDTQIVIKNNGEVIRTIKKDYLIPAEMENINLLTKGLTPGVLEVEVE